MASDAAAQCVHEGTRPHVVYRPRSPEDGVLHRIVREHLETFLQEVSTRTGGHPLPAFVEREFRDFIWCGSFARAGEPAGGGHQVATPRPANDEDEGEAKAPRRRHRRWADLMRRTFSCDVLRCPRCSGRLRFIATIESPEAIRRILTHLGLPTTVPRALPARAPPGATDDLFQEVPA